MCDEERAFLAAIEASPGDATARLVFADWLDEQARHEEAAHQRLIAPGWRALVGLGVTPCPSCDVNASPYRADDLTEPPYAFCGPEAIYGDEISRQYLDRHTLPQDWIVAMGDPTESIVHWSPDYETVPEVMDAAAVAFASLPAERRNELLTAKVTT